MEVKEIKEAVRTGLGEAKEALIDEIRNGLSDADAERFKGIDEQLADVQKKLNELQNSDAEPDDTKVVDLEKKMVELESRQKEIAENVRLMNAQPVLNNGEAEDSIEKVFRGTFIKDARALREVIRNQWKMGGVEARALDSTLIASAGKLPPQAANAFIDFVISQQAALSVCTVLRMNSPQGYTDELRVSSRKLRAATEATAPTVADAVSTARRTLTTVEVIWAEDLTLTLLEDAIERRGTEAHIARLIATGFGNDLNDLAWNGDDSSSDSFLSINDGWIVLAEADSDVNDVTSFASSIDTAKEVFAEMWKSVPTKFLGRPDFAYFVPVVLAQNYADEVADRATTLGDNVLVNGFPVLRYFGRKIIAEAHLSAATGKAMLTPTVNLHFGIQRAVNIDSEWKPRKRVIEYTITARNDYEYATGEAIVLAANIPASLLT